MLILLSTEHPFLFNTQKLANSEKCSVDYLTDEKQVCKKPCLLLEIGATFVSEYVHDPPDSVDDVDNVWTDDYFSIDSNINTFAECIVPADTFTGFLVFDLEELMYVTQYYHAITITGIGKATLQVDYWDGTNWINVHLGEFIPSTGISYHDITPAVFRYIRIRLIRTISGLKTFRVREFGVTKSGMFDIRLYDGFSTHDTLKQQIVIRSTGKYFTGFAKPVYFQKGIFVNYEGDEGTVYLRYVILKGKEWSIPQISQRPKIRIPVFHRFVQLYRLIRDWFTK